MMLEAIGFDILGESNRGKSRGATFLVDAVVDRVQRESALFSSRDCVRRSAVNDRAYKFALFVRESGNAGSMLHEMPQHAI